MKLSRFRQLAAAVATIAFAAACSDAPTGPRSAEPAPSAPPPAAPAPLFGFDRPTLLQCPSSTAQTTVGTIGALGGLVSLDGFAIDFPAGAVETPTLFALTVPASRYMKVDLTAVGFRYFQFDAPVTVTIDYSRCPVEATQGRNLSVWYVLPILNLPIENMGGTNDPAARRITFTTDHFSSYVIAY